MNLLRKLATVASMAACIGFAVPSISHAAVGDQTLYPGTKDNDVAQLQHILKDKGYFQYPESTGYYGPITTKAVKDFQKDHDLSVDGIVGSKTFSALKIGDSIGPELLSSGDEGYDVTVIQDKLKELGYYKGNVDGLFGSLTLNAVKDFQGKKDLAVDGLVGPKTKHALGLSIDQDALPGDANAAKTEIKQPKQEPEKQPEKKVSAEKSAPKPDKQKSAKSEGKTISVHSTAYTANCSGCSGKTATGLDLKANPNAKVIAVDPNVIPLGTKVYVPGYGTATAADTGGAINGNRIDIFFSSKDKATNWGNKQIKVTILK
ncbi:3D (Asp-Asp-Asp) domain-containing protein [Scopulibacillus darangshiensis]|uniref:3D (Asp-Asp-Asp) domain-containing protein n=1 Tax=Scopulibacillus darangshiensis TaxID=442528 RepID=A0A4R2P4W9_9BACL|nr:peptidoglycan-binding protein [Scopulibacillus darangshiensis]TCP29228.1 3D (Asp-Asp-Asp) domain-containing protein [Scopulibacillus darangshiensis]